MVGAPSSLSWIWIAFPFLAGHRGFGLHNGPGNAQLVSVALAHATRQWGWCLASFIVMCLVSHHVLITQDCGQTALPALVIGTNFYWVLSNVKSEQFTLFWQSTVASDWEVLTLIPTPSHYKFSQYVLEVNENNRTASSANSSNATLTPPDTDLIITVGNKHLICSKGCIEGFLVCLILI